MIILNVNHQILKDYVVSCFLILGFKAKTSFSPLHPIIHP